MINAASLLQKALDDIGIETTKPEDIEAGQKILRNGLSQFVIDNLNDTTIKHLAQRICGIGNTIQFHELVLPKGLLKSEIQKHNNIYVRYLEDYEHFQDNILQRWDVLVSKADK